MNLNLEELAHAIHRHSQMDMELVIKLSLCDFQSSLSYTFIKSVKPGSDRPHIIEYLYAESIQMLLHGSGKSEGEDRNSRIGR